MSCAGQVSLGCALPLLGALNLAPTVLPTALLSTHTGGFGENTYLDLSKEMISILQHWKTLSLKFSAIYLGYLGEKPLDVLQENLADVSTAETMLLIDPVMGDHGKLYRGFDQEYVEKMRCLISKADIATPNYTEAKLLLGEPLTTSPVATDDAFETARKVQRRFNLRNIVLTGIDSCNGLDFNRRLRTRRRNLDGQSFETAWELFRNWRSLCIGPFFKSLVRKRFEVCWDDCDGLRV